MPDPAASAELAGTRESPSLVRLRFEIANTNLTAIEVTRLRIRRPVFAKVALGREGPFHRTLRPGWSIAARRLEQLACSAKLPWFSSLLPRCTMRIELWISSSASTSAQRRITITRSIPET